MSVISFHWISWDNINIWGLLLFLFMLYLFWSYFTNSYSFNFYWNSGQGNERSREKEEPPSPLLDVSLFIGTWDMGGSAPPTLNKWLQPSGKKYDIYAIGVIGCVYKENGPGTLIGFETESAWFSQVEQIIDAEEFEYSRIKGEDKFS